MRAVGVPPARAAAGRGPPGRLPACASPAAAATSIRGLVSHDDLDWAPLGAQAGSFLNLMTSRTLDGAAELRTAAARIAGGGVAVELLLLPGGAAAAGLPVLVLRCSRPARALARRLPCAARPVSALSVNLVSHAHVDVPFHNDGRIGVVEHVFAEDALRSVQEFRAELYSARFDEQRLHLI